MAENGPEQSTPPDLPDYVREPLASQSPERLEMVAAYANELAAWKRHQREQDREQRRAEDAIDPDDRAALEERGVSTEPADYEAVPTSGAYITVKTTKQTSETAYRYYYWQWRGATRGRTRILRQCSRLRSAILFVERALGLSSPRQ